MDREERIQHRGDGLNMIQSLMGDLREDHIEAEQYPSSKRDVYIFSIKSQGYETPFRLTLEVPKNSIDIESEPLKLHPLESAFLREQAAFEKCLPQLLQQWPGWFAAFYNEQLIDKDEDEYALAARIEQTHRGEFVLIRRISRASPEDFFNSPELEVLP